jgi:hypothetical protein
VLGYQSQNQRLQLAEGYAKRWEKAENTKMADKILYRKLQVEQHETTKWGMNLYAQEG